MRENVGTVGWFVEMGVGVCVCLQEEKECVAEEEATTRGARRGRNGGLNSVMVWHGVMWRVVAPGVCGAPWVFVVMSCHFM